MSSDDIWYFLKGQESLGPFSKSILQQIHGGGQISPETLVWREGMEGWKAAKEIPELEIQKKPEAPQEPTASQPSGPASSETPSAPSAGISRSKLKLKFKESSTIPELKVPAQKSTPAPTNTPAEPTSSASLRRIIANKNSAAQHSETVEKKRRTYELPSFVKQGINYFFSSLFLTPAFLIACGWIVFFHKDRFPNVLWFTWMVIGLGGFGIVSLAGIRSLDGFFRILSLLLLAPPLVLFWPVIMRENSWQTIPVSHWIFLGFCLFYCLTARIGLRAYNSKGLAALAVFMGLITLGFIHAVAKSIWTPPSWDQLVISGDHIRLPPALARVMNKPEWATAVGSLHLGNSSHNIEKASLKQMNNGENRLTIKTVDELYFVAKIKAETNPLDPRKIIGQSLSVAFTPESDKADLEAENARFLLLDGKKTEISTATLKIDNITGDFWRGTLDLEIASGKETPAAHMTGSFETTVKAP